MEKLARTEESIRQRLNSETQGHTKARVRAREQARDTKEKLMKHLQRVVETRERELSRKQESKEIAQFIRGLLQDEAKILSCEDDREFNNLEVQCSTVQCRSHF